MPLRNQEIGPYLNPQYWDGLMIGQTQPEPRPADHANAARRLKANINLLNILRGVNEFNPQDRLASGEVFDAQQHPKRTVIMFREEELSGSGLVSRLNLGANEEEVSPP